MEENPPFPFNTEDITAEIAQLNDALFNVPEPPLREVGTWISSKTGGAITENEAQVQEIENRALSYRGERWFRPLYGTRLADIFNYNNVPSVIFEAISVLRRSQLPASDRYRVVDITYESEKNKVTFYVNTTNIFGRDEETTPAVPIELQLS